MQVDLKRRAAALMLCGLAFPAAAQTTSAEAFLEGIYRPYLARGFNGTDYGQTARYFAPALAAAIDKDMREAKRRGEVPTLNGDPFIDAQDWEIADLRIAVASTGATTATAAVSFSNFRKPVQVTVDLIQTNTGWRIADIRAPSGSLKALYKLR